MWAHVLRAVSVLLLWTSGPARARVSTTNPMPNPIPDTAAAEAQIVVARSFLAASLQHHIDDTLHVLADIPAEIPFIGTVHFRPAARVESVDVVVQQQRATVTVDVEGLLLPVDAELAPINWRGKVTAVVVARLERNADNGLDIVFAPVADTAREHPVHVDVEVDGLDGFAPRVAATAERQLLVLQRQHGPLSLLRIPSTTAAHVRGARVRSQASAIVVDLDLDNASTGRVLEAPVTERGVAVRVADEAVCGLVVDALQAPSNARVVRSSCARSAHTSTVAFRITAEPTTNNLYIVARNGAVHVDIDPGVGSDGAAATIRDVLTWTSPPLRVLDVRATAGGVEFLVDDVRDVAP